ncbi:MAG: NrtR DNA-binding winged helix domain-containing protein [Candidatus Nanopelagicales bacterium]
MVPSPSLSSLSDLEGFPGVHMAVDIAVMTVGELEEDGTRKLMTLLVKRPDGYKAGTWTLPGRFLRKFETLSDACEICLDEKAGIRGFPSRQLLVLDDPKRDERGWTMSVGHIAPIPFAVAIAAMAGLPAMRDLAVVTDRQIRFRNSQVNLPFDQQKTVDAAVNYLRDRYLRLPDPKGFLGPRFTMSELYQVHMAILGKDFMTPYSFRRTFEPLLEATSEKRSETAGKPATIYKRARRASSTPRRLERPSESRIARDK